MKIRPGLPPVTGQFTYRPATNPDGTSPQPGWDLVWISPRSGQYSGREHTAKILDCWYPASYMRAVREHLGRAQPPSELRQPAATNLLGAHVEFTSPDEAYADLSNALLASRLKSSADGYQFEQQEIWSDRGDLLVEDLDSTLRAKHVEESDRSFGQNLQPNRLALDRRRLDTRFACCNAGFPLAEPFEGLANLQCGFRRFRAPKPARTEGIVLLVGYFRVEQGSGLNALTGRNPHVPLGHGETRVGSKRARKRIPHRKGLRMRNAHEARAGQKCHRARKTHGCFAKHESYQSDRSRARALRKGAQVRRLGGGVSSPG